MPGRAGQHAEDRQGALAELPTDLSRLGGPAGILEQAAVFDAEIGQADQVGRLVGERNAEPLPQGQQLRETIEGQRRLAGRPQQRERS